MIGESLVFLKDQLNTYLKSIMDHDGTQPDPVDTAELTKSIYEMMIGDDKKKLPAQKALTSYTVN